MHATSTATCSGSVSRIVLPSASQNCSSKRRFAVTVASRSTVWAAKRFYGANANEVTWRPVTSIPLAATDGNPETAPDPGWSPLVTTPSHPEYPAGHPGQNGAAATVLLSYFDDAQTFTLTTSGQPDRTYTSIAQARSDANNARIWGGMHYPSTILVSDGVGEAIALYVNENSMRRVQGVGQGVPVAASVHRRPE